MEPSPIPLAKFMADFSVIPKSVINFSAFGAILISDSLRAENPSNASLEIFASFIL